MAKQSTETVVTVAPVFGRCIEVLIDGKEAVTLKVVGPKEQTIGLRDKVLGALLAAGLGSHTPEGERDGKGARRGEED